MPIAELAVLLPCHSLEDFPLYYQGDEAAELLACWVAPWHPALIAATGKMPRWYRADVPPDDSEGRVYFVSAISARILAAGWTARVEAEGALVIAAQPDRDQMVAQALSRCGIDRSSVAADLAGDFLALGYAYLQLELLTRQMRYLSSIDEPYFENQLVAAARAAVEHGRDAAIEHLQRCFDVLMEARDRFYPVDAYLLDLTLVAQTLIGPALRATLLRDLPASIHLSGQTLERLAEQDPALLDALRQAVSAGNVSVVGGEYEESDLPLAPLLSVVENLEHGRAVYEKYLGQPARVFLRRRFGLSPILPMLLSRAGFIGAVHCTFDDGVFPALGQSKTRWQALDGSAIDALCRIPLDASRAETFLSFSQKLAESMDLDQVATVGLVHWPGKVAPWFDDLKRIHRYAPIFGKFVTLEHYFEHTDSPGRLDKLEPDAYRSPYLRQMVARGEPDPISRYARAFEADLRARAARTALALAAMTSPAAASATSRAGQEDDLARAVEMLATAVSSDSNKPQKTHFLLNPFGHPCRWPNALNCEESHSGQTIHVPACGFAWCTTSPSEHAEDKRRQPLAAENVVANEFLQVTIDPTTGGIRSVRDLRHRGNRLSQQLALRLPGAQPRPGDLWRSADEQASYSRMAADDIAVANGPGWGSITSRGRLLDAATGQPRADFEQRVTLAAACCLAVIDIRLDPGATLPADPWNAYYACRFAWADEAAELVRSVQQTAQRTTLKRLEAPHFIEIREDKLRTAILTGGLPFHRRSSDRMLDTILIVAGESRRHFRLAIGLDLPAIAGHGDLLILGGLPRVELSVSPQSWQAGWFFHLDAGSVVPLDWSPLMDEGRCRGFRARLLETQGQAGQVNLRTFKPVAEATQIDATGGAVTKLSVSPEAILIWFSAFELVEIEAHWKT
jgi:alpha-mannosidase